MHVKLGLDETSELIVCKCKNPTEVLKSIMRKYTSTTSNIVTLSNATIDPLPSSLLNAVTVSNQSHKANTEVEVRLDQTLAACMFSKMEGATSRRRAEAGSEK